jgi:hypothetical protein
MPELPELSEPERPARMYRQGRSVDSEFLPDEILYLRILREHIDNLDATEVVEDLRLALMAIRYPDFSVNRQKYSEPEDVIFGLAGWGIAHFKVEHVPPTVEGEQGSTCEFKVEHVPEPDNYSHSEVRAYKNGQHDRKMKLPTTVKSVYRQKLAEKARILLKPSV